VKDRVEGRRGKMKPTYLYDLKDRPPFQHLLLYGFQWAFIMFPALLITATLGAGSLAYDGSERMRFLQFSQSIVSTIPPIGGTVGFCLTHKAIFTILLPQKSDFLSPHLTDTIYIL
jgi:xanthine/uracil permease